MNQACSEGSRDGQDQPGIAKAPARNVLLPILQTNRLSIVGRRMVGLGNRSADQRFDMQRRANPKGITRLRLEKDAVFIDGERGAGLRMRRNVRGGFVIA